MIKDLKELDFDVLSEHDLAEVKLTAYALAKKGALNFNSWVIEKIKKLLKKVCTDDLLVVYNNFAYDTNRYEIKDNDPDYFYDWFKDNPYEVMEATQHNDYNKADKYVTHFDFDSTINRIDYHINDIKLISFTEEKLRDKILNDKDFYEWLLDSYHYDNNCWYFDTDETKIQNEYINFILLRRDYIESFAKLFETNKK